jgi:hypothetical protein
VSPTSSVTSVKRPSPVAAKELRLLPDGQAEDLRGVADEEVDAAVGVWS